MLSKLTGLLCSIKMTATEWLLVGSATIIAGLVAALKLQGSRLHRAQVDLLSERFEVANQRMTKKAQSDHDSYAKAIQAYTNAGGKL